LVRNVLYELRSVFFSEPRREGLRDAQAGNM
jgi:hypothetical protein